MGVDPKGKAITDKSFEAASKASEMTTEKSRKNAHDLLMKGIK